MLYSVLSYSSMILNQNVCVPVSAVEYTECICEYTFLYPYVSSSDVVSCLQAEKFAFYWKGWEWEAVGCTDSEHADIM